MFLMGLLKNWKLIILIAVAAVVGIMWWRISYLSDRNDYLKTELEASEAILDAHQEAVKNLEAALERAQNRRIIIDRQKEGIRNAPESDNGGLAPVLRDTLEFLQSDERKTSKPNP